MRSIFTRLVFLGTLALGFAILSLNAQPPPPPPAAPPQDPLIALMLSQPKIEFGVPVTAVAWFDPPTVATGQTAYYRVTFNALEESIAFPAQIIAPTALTLRPGAHGQILQPAGVNIEPRTTFSYRVRASQPGEFTVPSFTVQVYGKTVTVPATKLMVSPPGASAASPQQLTLEMPATNLFVGQPANVRILLHSFTTGFPQLLTQVQLAGQGFIIDQGAVRQKMEGAMRGSSNVITFIHETVLTPVAGGTLEVFAQGFTTGPRFSTPLVSSNGAVTLNPNIPQYVLIESEPAELSVRPLPKQGELPGFTGAIGMLSVEPPKLATNVLRVGDPVKLSVIVRSGNGFARLVAPPPPRVRDWQVLAATPEGEPAQLLQAHGFATFDYTLIPMSEETRATPAIPFSCFDPNSVTYIDLTIPPVPVTVHPGRAPADLAALLQQPARNGEGEEELKLSGLAKTQGMVAATLTPLQRQAWFPLVQLAPIAAFLGLWGWDRRRRYLEEHPEILLRRRARRALRRQWRALRRAARGGDEVGFATAAVGAMRVACAPHFPAEPRALVGRDVLQLLSYPETKADGTAAVVRRFFAVSDASQFSLASGKAPGLLGLQPELERVLQQLEARL